MKCVCGCATSNDKCSILYVFLFISQLKHPRRKKMKNTRKYVFFIVHNGIKYNMLDMHAYEIIYLPITIIRMYNIHTLYTHSPYKNILNVAYWYLPTCNILNSFLYFFIHICI